MPARLPWFERKWTFNQPVDVYPDVIERLRGAPARIEDMVRGISAEVLTRREREGTWSIQENIGHLIELDELHDARITEFLAGTAVLRAADVTNRRTHSAGYNDRPVQEICAAFRRRRGEMVARLESLRPEDFARSSRHPRLDVPMRLVDMCIFTADHDDYHLARVRELLRMFAK